MLKPRYKAIVFDFDDTLVESRMAKWAQHTHVAKNFYNVDLTEEKILEHWGKPIHIMAPELYENSDTWENIYPKLLLTKKNFPKKLYEQSLKVITELLDKSIKIGILSATTRKDIVEDLKKFNFPVERFSFIQGAEDTAVHKPNPKVFLPAFEQLQKEGIDLKDVVYAGDSLDDMRAATEAGIDFIAVTTGLYSAHDFRKNGAKMIVKNIDEIIRKIIY